MLALEKIGYRAIRIGFSGKGCAVDKRKPAELIRRPAGQDR